MSKNLRIEHLYSQIFKHLTSLEVEDSKDMKSGYSITFVSGSFLLKGKPKDVTSWSILCFFTFMYVPLWRSFNLCVNTLFIVIFKTLIQNLFIHRT